MNAGYIMLWLGINVVGDLCTNNWLLTNALGDIQMHKEIYKYLKPVCYILN